jgi:multicomponent Na+:H+ antiporter subunit G
MVVITNDAIAAVLLAAGVLVEWIACLGLLAMRNPFDRLHAVAPANILPPVFVATAVIAQGGFSQAGIKAILIALVLILTSPVVTHAVARCAHIRQTRESKK